MEIKDFETKVVGRRLIWTDTGRETGKQHGVFYIDRAEYSRETDKVQLYNQQQRVFGVTPSIVLALITTGRYMGNYTRGRGGDMFRKEYTLAEVSEYMKPNLGGVSLKNDTMDADATEMVRRLVGRRLRWFDSGRPQRLQHGMWHVDAVEVRSPRGVVLDLSNGEHKKRAVWGAGKIQNLITAGGVTFEYNDGKKIVYTLEG